MDQGQTIRQGRLIFLDTHAPLPAPAELALHIAVTLTRWSQRARTRRALKRLEREALADIGLTPDQAWREAVLPFWRD